MLDRDTLYTRKTRKDKAAKLKSQEAELRHKGQASRYKPYAQVSGDLVYGVADVIGEWLVGRAMKTSKTTNITLPDKLAMVSIRDLAVMTLQNAVNSAAMGEKVTPTAQHIGQSINNYLMDKSFKKQHKDAHGWVCRQIKKRNLQPKYQAAFKRKVAQHKGIELEGLSLQERVQSGLLLLDLLVKHGVLEYRLNQVRKGKGFNTVKTVALSETFLEAAKRSRDALIWMSPVSKPMVKEPNPWTGPWSMVYTDVLEPLVKRGESADNGKHLEMLEQADLTQVLSAINTMQATPFRVNTRVAEVLRWAFEQDTGIAGLAHKSDRPLPEKPLDIATNEKARTSYKKRARAVHEANSASRSERYTVDSALATCALLKGQPIYFPLQLDFRGRVYPMPSVFQIQGPDYVRCLIEFNEGKHCDETAMRWLKIHGANLWGFDKVSYDDRVKWVQEHWDQIVDVARDPKQVTWWHDADKPWSFLAWCFDVVDAAAGKPSRCRVGLDGSCNGLQHFSAMLRDPVGAVAVNLKPSDIPSDIYQQVADRVNEKLKEEKGHKKQWADIWRTQVKVDRKICKRSVMVMPYGGKMISTMDYVEEEFKSRIGSGTSPFGDDTGPACNYLGRLVYDATREIIVGGKHAMDWLQEAAKVASKYNQHIKWTLPHGFVARQHYVEQVKQRVSAKLEGNTGPATFGTIFHPTRNLHKSKSVNGISPNFVHSLDACALMMTVNKARERGIKSFLMVHDDYSTHAADTEVLNECLRQAFVELYRDHDVLADFRTELLRQLPRRAAKEIPPVPKKGTFDIEEVLRSEYFFG